MKAVVAAFNQEKALVGAFSVIVQLHRLIVYSTTALSKVEAEDVLTLCRCVSPSTVSWFIAEGQIHWSSHFLPPQGENCDLNYLADIL